VQKIHTTAINKN